MCCEYVIVTNYDGLNRGDLSTGQTTQTEHAVHLVHFKLMCYKLIGWSKINSEFYSVLTLLKN